MNYRFLYNSVNHVHKISSGGLSRMNLDVVLLCIYWLLLLMSFHAGGDILTV